MSIDEEIAQLCERREFRVAATRILETYGGEVMRFLVRRTQDAQLASEAFAIFSEDLWRGLPGFAFRSSVRTWLYSLAYHAYARVRRASGRAGRRRVALSEIRSGSPARSSRRTETPVYLRTEIKQRMRDLQERLPHADRTLLELRLVQRFSWKDIARVLLDLADHEDAARIEKEAARLRKRFQLARDKLREMAKAEGLVGDD